MTALASDTFGMFGTTAVLVVTDPDALAGARAAADAELAAIDHACSRFRQDSELSMLNNSGGQLTPISALLAELIAEALRAAELTDGDVDPTCGHALIAAGYDRDFAELQAGPAAVPALTADSGRPAPRATGRGAAWTQEPGSGDEGRQRPKAPRPSGGSGGSSPRADTGGSGGSSPRADTGGSGGSSPRADTGGSGGSSPRASTVPGWRSVWLDPVRPAARLAPGTRLDLGATAKAWAADRCAKLIADRAGCGVLVSLGGDIAAAGPPPGDGWRVRVTDDHAAGAGDPGQTVAIRTGGLATSSITVRTWISGGTTRHHIIDPRTGEPARSCWRTVSVAAATCTDANIASTAAIIRGEAARGWLAEAGLPARLVRLDGTVERTPGWPADDQPDSRESGRSGVTG